MKLMAIDPGTVESAYVIFTCSDIKFKGKVANVDLYRDLFDFDGDCVIERIAGYGMNVGEEVFATCEWCGRFDSAYSRLSHRFADRITRKAVKVEMCGTTKANDSAIRQRIVDLYGGKKAIGTKKNPGPLYGFAKDTWQALAVGLVWQKQNGYGRLYEADKVIVTKG